MTSEILKNWKRRRTERPMFTSVQVENCLASAVECWGESLFLQYFSPKQIDFDEHSLFVYAADPIGFKLSYQINFYHDYKFGNVWLYAIFDGKPRRVGICRPKELFHQAFWKLRCGLVEAGAIPDTVYPSADVMQRFSAYDAQYHGHRLTRPVELAVAFAIAEDN